MDVWGAGERGGGNAGKEVCGIVRVIRVNIDRICIQVPRSLGHVVGWEAREEEGQHGK
jgi:hypothetical protein